MRAGTLDLAFYSTEGRPVPSDFCEETLFTSGHVLLMRRGHPLHQKWLAGSEITEADTGAWPHISVVVPMAGGSDRLTMSRHPAHGPERTACETPFFVAGAMLAARTDMLMRIPQETAAELCRTLPLAMMPMEAGIHIPGFRVSSVTERQTMTRSLRGFALSLFRMPDVFTQKPFG